MSFQEHLLDSLMRDLFFKREWYLKQKLKKIIKDNSILNHNNHEIMIFEGKAYSYKEVFTSYNEKNYVHAELLPTTKETIFLLTQLEEDKHTLEGYLIKGFNLVNTISDLFLIFDDHILNLLPKSYQEYRGSRCTLNAEDISEFKSKTNKTLETLKRVVLANFLLK